MAKTEKIEIRINKELKENFQNYAQTQGKNISELIRDFIKECCYKNA